MRVLRSGMHGPAVRRWQQFLVAEGHLDGAVDGIFGPRTERASRAFQQAHGLDVDGVVGPGTRQAAAAALVAALVPTESELTPEPATPEPTPTVAVVETPVTPGQACPLTEARLRRVMPGIRPATCTAYAPFLGQAMEEFAINTPARASAFLAQLAHESGQLRWFEEIWGPTPAQRRYEPPTSLAARLGNTQPGDGKRFKGRGPIQLTGRDNYRRYGQALRVDLVANPPLAATKEVGFRVAGLFWQRNGLNELADQQRFRRITKRINGGFNGLADRVRFYERAKLVFDVPSMRARDDGGDDTGWRRFRRGLDGPGEVTPTAAERSVLRAAGASAGGKRGKRTAAKRTTKPKRALATRRRARKATGRKAAAPKTGRARTAAKSGARTRPATRARTR